ncbi:MAG: Crp/Fnr family transcriptional regulator [Gemmatimonadaceae bacterium]
MPSPRLSDSRQLTRDQRDALLEFGARTTWPAGFTIYERGASADGVFIVLSGQVVLRTPHNGGRNFIPWVAMPGETFGGEGMEAGAHYATIARTEEETETLHLSSTRFSALVRERPARALALMGQIVSERTGLLETFARHVTLSVEQRLIASLLRLSRPRNDTTGDEIGTGTISVSRRLIGEMVGATRESTSLVLGKLAAEGLVTRDGQRVAIADLNALLARFEMIRKGDASQTADREARDSKVGLEMANS